MAMNKPCNGSWNSKIQQSFLVMALGIVITLSGCATTTEVVEPQAVEPQATVNEADPYENFNRRMFSFNDKVDSYVAEPVSSAYKWITPQFMQTGVYNFFNNLKNINVVINDVLQAKFKQSAQDTGRFTINTTVGVVGLFDVAKHVGLEQNEEDFDQTLAVWGVPQGSYLVLPFLGPSTSRGIPGAVFDTAANPATYVGMPIQVVSMLNTRASAEGALKFIDEAALDPYVFTRESFLQWRNNLATDGKAEATSDVDGFEEELDDGDKGEASKPALSGDVNAGDKPSFALHLEAETKAPGQDSHSVGTAAQSFDNTAKLFEETSNKLDQLSKLKKSKKSKKHR